MNVLADLGTKISASTGTVTAAAAGAEKLELLSLNELALWVGIVCTVATFITSQLLNWWFKKRTLALQEALIDNGQQEEDG